MPVKHAKARHTVVAYHLHTYRINTKCVGSYITANKRGGGVCDLVFEEWTPLRVHLG